MEGSGADAGGASRRPFAVAFYGKGGIGKSTVSSNVSHILAESRRVVHIGCDPKHDSTRLLLPGGRQGTVLETIAGDGRAKTLGDVAVIGRRGVVCIESGGPEPGIGCAGRGIITAFNLLSELGLDAVPHDIRIYDVLGDVVCGGFAVPMRTDYSDAIAIVTSGEYMSLFAANNILRGLTHFDGTGPRILGIVQNSRGVEDEDAVVDRFAGAVGLPILARIPRDAAFMECEKANEPIDVLFPDSAPCTELRRIADAVAQASAGARTLFRASPLTDDDIEAVFRQKALAGRSRRACAESVRPGRGDILETCSAAGAVDIGYFVDDMDIVIHGPSSCAYIFSSFHDRMGASRTRGFTRTFCPSGERMRCTGLTDGDSIFGGAEKLERTLEDLASDGSRSILVVTACMAGIIGDDVGAVSRRVEARHPGTMVFEARCDGNMTGHMGKGLLIASRALLKAVDRNVRPEPDLVNILGMSFTKLSESRRSAGLDHLLELFGLRINCRFVGGCDMDSIRNLRRGRLNLVVSDVALARTLAADVEKETGIGWLDSPAPVGMGKTEEWIRRLGSALGMEAAAEEGVVAERRRYEELVSASKSAIQGRRIAMYSKSPRNVEWAVEFLTDCGADLAYAAFGPGAPGSAGAISVGNARIPVREGCSQSDIVRDAERDRLDLLIGRSEILDRIPCRHMELPDGQMGVNGLAMFAERIMRALLAPARSGWRDAE